ncbi:uncharacterized protein (DUF2336 family) [Rhodobium orientis]|uniref:DUF2336 domain-containing protein n=1 Tax=Rhodobium orientis TaxID=34017 RepID=A0A327JIF0_9HYPH|nr:hypothetical protein [Rhodobium orientis]MBB4303785.1 uncharacterized protein (DUF2336 family) [Rhodobium orientis]MBK5947903.1 hypothetical protein [Rhodobium orientis]RAI26069.1 hypothetical protein CH339_15510 [Rhodobium orientis]
MTPPPDGFDLLVSAKDSERAAALLRIAVDLFAALDTHSEGEVRQLGELCIHLLAECPAETRRYVAERLAPCRDAPRDLMRALALDEPEIARAVIVNSPALGEAELAEIAEKGGASAAALADRQDLPEAIRNLLDPVAPQAAVVGETEEFIAAEPAEKHSDRTDAPAAASEEEVVEEDSGTEGAVTEHQAEDQPPLRFTTFEDLADHFFDLTQAERKAAITAATNAAMGQQVKRKSGGQSAQNGNKADADKAAAEAGARFMAAAYAKDRRELIGELTERLQIRGDLAARILDDADGEALAVALVAIGVPEKPAFNTYLHAVEATGTSVERFTELTLYHRTLTPEIANLLIARWRGGGPAKRVATLSAPTAQRRPGQPRILLRLADKMPKPGTPPLKAGNGDD